MLFVYITATGEAAQAHFPENVLHAYSYTPTRTRLVVHAYAYTLTLTRLYITAAGEAAQEHFGGRAKSKGQNRQISQRVCGGDFKKTGRLPRLCQGAGRFPSSFHSQSLSHFLSLAVTFPLPLSQSLSLYLSLTRQFISSLFTGLFSLSDSLYARVALCPHPSPTTHTPGGAVRRINSVLAGQG